MRTLKKKEFKCSIVSTIFFCATHIKDSEKEEEIA